MVDKIAPTHSKDAKPPKRNSAKISHLDFVALDIKQFGPCNLNNSPALTRLRPS